MNFKHLHYFWVAARAGGVVDAGREMLQESVEPFGPLENRAGQGGTADPEVCAVAKTWNGSRILLVINTSNEAKMFEFSRTANRYAGIRGYLSATGAAAILRGDQLTLPPMSIVVLK